MVDKVGKYLFGILVPILLIIGLMEYMHTSQGSAFFSSIFGNYPFARQIMNLIQKVSGYKEEIPIASTSSFFYDLVKLMISAIIKGGVVSILLSIFCSIPVFDDSDLNRAGITKAEAVENYVNRPGYMVKALFVNVIASLFIVGISNEIIKYLIQYLSTHFSAIVVGIIVLMLAVICIFIFVKSVSREWGVFLVGGILIRIGSLILDVLGLNVLCLCLYASVYSNGFGSKSIGIVVLIFVWTASINIVKKFALRALD